MTTTTDIIDAIRSHPKIGRWTCSVIDECYSDAELIAEFGTSPTGKTLTVAGAVRKAVAAHNAWAARERWYGGI